MNELITLEEDEYQEDEEHQMGSWNHSVTQSRVVSLFSHDERFIVPVELSLDVSQIDLSQFGLKVKEELIPDVCLYPKDVSHPKRGDDILKMSDMPLLVAEVLSPKQTLDEIIAKFKVYFALGVKSCWLVVPVNESVTVYSTPHQFRTFGIDAKEIVDDTLNLRLPIEKLFR
jgi:Uma2 family endonuclease